ncbi:MAG: ectoine hydroxylase [Pseudohongiellaceae bacterium]
MNSYAQIKREQKDLYPSRQPKQEASVIERQEPVVYADAREPAGLSQAQISQYQKQGYLTLDGVFSQAEVSSWQAELQRLRNNEAIKSLDETITESGSQSVRSIFAVHRLSKVFRELAQDTRLVRLAEYLLDDQVYIHQSRVNYKPGFRGKEFYWHSDFETWHVEDGMPAMRALSMSISLTHNYSTNGPLLLIPGSHREFLACEGETPKQHFKSSLKRQAFGVPDDENLARLVQNNGITQFTGEPGSVCLFDSNIMHGSNSNISPNYRSNVFFVFNAMSNRVVAPFSGQPPRPEHICTREMVVPINTSNNTMQEEKNGS